MTGQKPIKKRVRKALLKKEKNAILFSRQLFGNHSASTDIASNTRGRINIIRVENIKKINRLNRYTFLEITRSAFGIFVHPFKIWVFPSVVDSEVIFYFSRVAK